MSKFVFDKKTGKLEESPSAPVKEEVADTADCNNVEGAVETESVEDEEQVSFNKFSDLRIARIDDEATGEWLCYFAGYNLDIQFNVKELKGAHAMQKIDAALDGLNKLFRKIILDQVLE